MNHISISQALKALSNSESKFTEVFTHGSLSVEMYKPENIDLQQPHSKDEVYIIVEGQGSFIHNEKTSKVSKGDFLFVPAGDEHKFIDFSDDFCTWVIFYGPEGGE